MLLTIVQHFLVEYFAHSEATAEQALDGAMAALAWDADDYHAEPTRAGPCDPPATAIVPIDHAAMQTIGPKPPCTRLRRRKPPGASPMWRLKARLNEASDS